jgi:hypothetical protein
MKKRKKFLRICPICKKEEIVRSDQLKLNCKDCRIKNLVIRTKNWIKKNPDEHKKNSAKNKKHGLWDKRIYRIYKSMKERCGHTTVKHKFAIYYSDRGIKVCDEWLNDRISFFNWAFANGYNDSLQIDRIDPDKGYSPNNCRWVTPKENQANRRDRKLAIPSS